MVPRRFKVRLVSRNLTITEFYLRTCAVLRVAESTPNAIMLKCSATWII